MCSFKQSQALNQMILRCSHCHRRLTLRGKLSLMIILTFLPRSYKSLLRYQQHVSKAGVYELLSHKLSSSGQAPKRPHCCLLKHSAVDMDAFQITTSCFTSQQQAALNSACAASPLPAHVTARWTAATSCPRTRPLSRQRTPSAPHRCQHTQTQHQVDSRP